MSAVGDLVRELLPHRLVCGGLGGGLGRPLVGLMKEAAVSAQFVCGGLWDLSDGGSAAACQDEPVVDGRSCGAVDQVGFPGD